MKIININGPINAGKTTVSTALAAKIPNTLFIEVDDLLSDSEQASLGLSREEGWQERIKRLLNIFNREKRNSNFDTIIFAYPMTDKLYKQWKSLENSHTKFINITLAPRLDVCLKNRGCRELTQAEQKRIREMYQEGYHCSKFADLIIDNSVQTPQETVQTILLFLERLSHEN